MPDVYKRTGNRRDGAISQGRYSYCKYERETRLNNLITLPAGVYLTYADAINDRGQIAAQSSDGYAYLF